MGLVRLSEFFSQYPCSSNVIFSFILIILEKFVENDFVCPCVKGFTEAMFYCYLLLPILITFVFGLYLLSFECRLHSSKKICLANVKKFFACLISPVAWLVLFLCDGRYVACLETTLKSEHADSDEKPPWEWCSRVRNLTADQTHAENVFFESRLAGFAVLLLFSLIALIYKCCQYCRCYKKCAKRRDNFLYSSCKKFCTCCDACVEGNDAAKKVHPESGGNNAAKEEELVRLDAPLSNI